MEKRLRSPFWSMLSVAIVLLALTVRLLEVDMPNWALVAANVALVAGVALVLIWVALAISFNRKHPSRRILLSGLYPVEFREEDEGMRWLTYRACRRVYIFFYVALPLAMVAMFLVPESRLFPVALIGALAVSQHFIYWSVVRKADVEEER